MSKRAGNLERRSLEEIKRDKEILVDRFLVEEGMLCPFCKDLECEGRGEKTECAEWPAHEARK